MVWQSLFRTPVDRQLQPRNLCRALADSIGARSTASSEERCEYVRGVLARLEPQVGDGTPVGSEDAKKEKREILEALLGNDTPARLLENLNDLNFETKKDAMQLFTVVLRLAGQLGMEKEIVEYVNGSRRILDLLLDGSKNPELALHCGLILRACIRYPIIVKFLFEADVALQLVNLAKHKNFDISSDAFASLRELLLKNKAESAEYMQASFKDFFDGFNVLLQADDYVTQRQALRLLGEILLDRSFTPVMLSYVGNDQFLQIHMNLLRDTSKSIQFETFHVFKIFAANPRKPPRVQAILHKNRDRLVKLLETFRSSREDDGNFNQDLKAVVEALKVLPAPTVVPSGPSSLVTKTPSSGSLPASAATMESIDQS